MLLGIRLRQILGILRNGDDTQLISVILEREPLGDMLLGTGRNAPTVALRVGKKASGFNNQRVSFPVSDRVAQLARLQSAGKRLAPAHCSAEIVVLVAQIQDFGILTIDLKEADETEGRQWRSDTLAGGNGIAVECRCRRLTFFGQRQILRNVTVSERRAAFRRKNSPDAAEVRLSVHLTQRVTIGLFRFLLGWRAVDRQSFATDGVYHPVAKYEKAVGVLVRAPADDDSIAGFEGFSGPTAPTQVQRVVRFDCPGPAVVLIAPDPYREVDMRVLPVIAFYGAFDRNLLVAEVAARMMSCRLMRH